MKVKTTITFEMENEIVPEIDYKGFETAKEMKERYSNFILEDIYSRLEGSARNIYPVRCIVKCAIDYEDGSKDGWINTIFSSFKG